MREVAGSILAEAQEKDLETLNSFFEIAKAQNWVSSSDILAIQKEYDNLRSELAKEKPKKNNPFENKDSQSKTFGNNLQQPKGLAERQEGIITFLKENGRAQVWQLKQIFPEVTKRTLRRDFEQMLKKGVIKRIGERNNTFYQIKINES